MRENPEDHFLEVVLPRLEENYKSLWKDNLDLLKDHEEGISRGSFRVHKSIDMDYILEKKGDKWGILAYENGEEGLRDNFSVVNILGEDEKINDLKLTRLNFCGAIITPYLGSTMADDLLSYGLENLAVVGIEQNSRLFRDVIQFGEKGNYSDREDILRWYDKIVMNHRKKSLNLFDLDSFYSSRASDELYKVE